MPNHWTREQTLAAWHLYCHIPFGRFHSRNPDLITAAARLGRTPSAVAMKLSNLASVHPEFIASGRKGLGNASRLDRAVFDEIRADWASFAESASRVFSELGLDPRAFGLEPAGPEPLLAEPDDGARSGSSQGHDHATTERITQQRVRRGQGFFRAAVLSNYNGACWVSGVSHHELLVASHIVPWSEDVSTRLDPGNGIALSALHDRAFDRGLMTITADYRVEVSTEVRHDEDCFERDAIWRFHGRRLASPSKFPPRDRFLAYHREQIFRP